MLSKVLLPTLLLFALKDCLPNPPGPTPSPVPTPTVVISPTPTPTVPPTPVPTPTLCRASLPTNIAALTINDRCLYYTPSTGKCVTDSTPRVGDAASDEGYCGKVTGNPAIHSCKANPEGSQQDGCDEQFLGLKLEELS